METREVLLKADKVVLVIERISDGKIRVTTTSWDDAKVILPNQVLEVATVGKPVGRVEAGYGPSHIRRNASQSQRDSFGATTFHGSRSRTTAAFAQAEEVAQD